MKVLHSICQQIWKTQQWPQDWKRSIFVPTTKKGNAKECSNYHTTALISHASEVTLTILQAGLQQPVHWERPGEAPQAEEPEVESPAPADHWKRGSAPEKHLLLLY